MNSCKDNATDNPQSGNYKIFYNFITGYGIPVYIYQMNIDGTNNIIFKTNAELYSPPQGGKIAFTIVNDSTGEYTLKVSNIDGTNENTILTDVWGILNASLSINNNKLLYIREKSLFSGGRFEYLHLCNIDGSNDILIDSCSWWFGNVFLEAEFSQDGNSIVYVIDPDFNNPSFYIYDINGNSKRKINSSSLSLPEEFLSTHRFNLSSDGKEIVFISFDSASSQYSISIINVSNGSIKEILKTSEYISKPVWSPDDKKIAYYKEPCNLWVIDVDTKVEIQFTDLPGPENEIRFLVPQWSPDGKYIIFEYSKDSGRNEGNLTIIEYSTGKVSTLIQEEQVATAFFGW